ncbi:hypothetical protein [Xenorhabdus szentirmaii]|uniref:hypothetical protein n=1 Tax=Xenorhabdus szentirmaii TaxID=290112 RepID=UPI0019A1F1B4|nr:hypothetical protein [Xenorhabdus sp. CUL]MBD2792720.1 hypothetical protein [Xenorhabdus sp. CUL]
MTNLILHSIITTKRAVVLPHTKAGNGPEFLAPLYSVTGRIWQALLQSQYRVYQG